MNLELLRERAAQGLTGWKDRLPANLMNAAYAGTAAGVLWPLVFAMQNGQVDVMLALGGLLSNLGANLLSNQIQKWRDEADAATQLDAAVGSNAELRNKLDEVLLALNAVPLAREALPEVDKAWYAEALRAELSRLGNWPRYEQHAQIEINAGRDINLWGDVVGRDKIVYNYTTTINNPAPEKTKWREAYLRSLLVGESRRLPLQALDSRLRTNAGGALALNEVYVPLTTLTPEEHDLWARGERGVEPDGEKRLSALNQLSRHQRLLLLGDPGFGKSTFVNFVTLCLAGAALNDPHLNVATLTAPVPQETKRDEKPKPQTWAHGPLLPVRVILREFAETMPANGASADLLWDFIERQLNHEAKEEFAADLKKELLGQGGLVLLDGLDEVPQANARRAQLIAIVENFAVAFAKCRVLVTGRVYAYRQQDWKLADFAVTTLAPFALPQMQAFAEQWYARLNTRHKLPATPEAMAAELLNNIRDRRQLYNLAEQPLLLTFMAGLRVFSPLPDRRQELYEKVVELLFNEWEQGKLTARVGEAPPSVAQLLRLSPDELRGALEELAYDAHDKQPADAGARTADITEEQLVHALYKLIKKRDNAPQIETLKAHVKDRAGLLVEHGAERYTFPHRTFQEYLAACHLTRTGTQKQVAELVKADPDRWREVTLLAAARWHSGGRDSLWNLARKLCPVELGLNPPLPEAWAAQVAGQALTEAGEEPTDADEAQTARVLKQSLLSLLAAPQFPAIERARAGRTLAVLGDPRPEVLTVENMPFAFIPKGDFVMGGDDDDNEKPQHTCKVLDYDYWLARYPVTVAQWAQFCQATQHTPADTDSLRDPANQPVRYVTWHEALKFCGWLNAKFPISIVGGRGGPPPSLPPPPPPSEAEWEKAARGGLQVPRSPAGFVTAKDLAGLQDLRGLMRPLMDNPAPAREYPWDNTADPNCANYADTQIGAPSAVGAFLNGASPYGVEDLSGNVWEWTRSLWGFAYPYANKLKERENLKARDSVTRVLRGGTFLNDAQSVRCASRGRNYPLNRLWDIGFRVAVSCFL